MLILAALSTSVQAGQSVTLAWDPSANPEVVGYNIYYGVANRTYTNKVNVGKVTSVTIPGLSEGTTYFFAVTAHDILGLESDYSTEASYTVPGALPRSVLLPSLQLTILLNRQVVLDVTGQVGHTYEIQASPNLTSWTVIGAVTVGASGSVQFTDTNAANYPARFYRVAEVLPPKIQIRVTPTKQVILTVTGQIGHTYDIQATRLFKLWTVIGTGTVGDSGSFEFVDTNAASFPARYYRARDRQP